MVGRNYMPVLLASGASAVVVAACVAMLATLQTLVGA